jgi:ABC-2 type transport system ATP-binding protein
MIILQTDGLTKRFGALIAVDDFTIAIPEGEVFGLLGPNGAGKTTVLKMLTTLLPPSAGHASVGGFDVVRQAGAVRRIIGYVPQMISADGNLSGYENLLIFAKLYDIPRRELRQRIQDALALMGLTAAGNNLVKTYSGGMVRRLEMAQSMLHRPRVLFLDEPTVGLDPAARHLVWEHIQQLQRDFGDTILVTTHLMEEADILCQRVAIMHHGTVRAIGAPKELKASLGQPDATLDDVFMHYAGDTLDAGGRFRDIRRQRRVARRLG